MNNSPEIFDIMDRYLDRAATPDEERRLFATLLEDETLSTEFQAQSQLRSVMDSDVTATIIPSDLYASIVESAQQASLLPIPLVGAASLATEWMIRSFMALATATTAALATIAATVLISTPPSIPSTPAPAVAASVPTPQQMQAPLPVPVATEKNEQSERSERSERMEPVQSVQPHGDDEGLIVTAPLLESERADVVRTSHDTAPTMVSIMEEENPLQPTPLVASLQLRITQTPLTYHMYATRTALTSAPNLGLEAEYAFTPEHAIGAVLHNDVFPVGVVTSDNTVQQQYAMLWGGASYRYTPQWGLPLGLQPFAQLNLGGSSRGVVAQPTLGLQLHVSHISISAGANMMTLFYQNNGTWNAASRVGMLVGIGIHL